MTTSRRHKNGRFLKASWWSKRSQTVKTITIFGSFLVMLYGLWGVLRIAGVDALDFFIGCSSVSSQTETNTRGIDTIKWKIKGLQKASSIQDSVNRFQDGLNDTVDNRIQRLEDE